MYVNERWCDPGHVTVKERRCTKDIELLAVRIWPYRLTWAFTHVILLTIYITTSADAMAACEDIHTTVSQLEMAHLQSLIIIISGDFNHASLSALFLASPTMLSKMSLNIRSREANRALEGRRKNHFSRTKTKKSEGT